MLRKLDWFLTSTKLNRILQKSFFVSGVFFFIIRRLYILDNSKNVYKPIFKSNIFSDEIFVKFFEHYFYHLCRGSYFKKAYNLKFIIIKSISLGYIKSQKITSTSLKLWRLISESADYQDFIGLPIVNNSPLLHHTTIDEFGSICQSMDIQSKVKLPSDRWIKLLGPLDNIQEVIEFFDTFICLKPYDISEFSRKSGVFLPNNYTLKNRIKSCIEFERINPMFVTILDNCQKKPRDINSISVSCQVIACGSSLMGLQKGLLVAFICGARKIDCDGFNLSVGGIKYNKSYPSSFHGKEHRNRLITESNYKHDLVFNFFFTKLAVNSLFDECSGQVLELVKLDVETFLSQFHFYNSY